MGEISGLTYGGLLVAVLANQACLPVPAPIFLITAGALTVHGHLNLILVLLTGLAGCLIGDGIWFWLGRRWGKQIIKLVCNITSDPFSCLRRADGVFARWGLRALIFAKFFPGPDAVTPPLVGAEGASTLAFVAYDSVGSLLWSTAYALLGVAFASQLQRAFYFAGRFGSWLLLIFGLPLVALVLVRTGELVRMVCYLRLRKISPEDLSIKMARNSRMAIFDLLNYEGQEEGRVGIPGALRIDPAKLRTRPFPVIPDDIDIILYCRTKSEFTSARVAVALQRQGVRRVWVLDGGLEAWQRENRPITNLLSTAEEMAGRLGVELPPRFLQSK